MTYRTGDIYADLRKRDSNPDSSWTWTLVLPTTQLKPSFDAQVLAQGITEPAWQAVYGPGKLGGRQTRISERRLKKLYYIGNVADMPFRKKLPQHRGVSKE